MNKLKSVIGKFTKAELILWSSSIVLIISSFMIFDRTNYITLTASIIGATALIFCAKGNPLGQILMIIFSSIYGVISYSYSYYGELMTYLFMTAPMSLFALISWLRHPYEQNKSEVRVGSIKSNDIILMSILSLIVTFIFYFILSYFNTANIVPSTLSVTTSFIAVFLTYKRSPFFALAYAFNDIVLIVLWILAAIDDISYLSVIICFIMFLVNDLYGFYNWQKMKKRQNGDVI